MNIYISGQITGKADYMQDFENAEKWLNEHGYKAVNPALICKPLEDKFNYKQIMSIDLLILSNCDGIYMLNGWQNSKGAKLELSIAKTLSKKILYQNYLGRNTNATAKM